MDIVQYDFSYMFYYSERPGTLAEKKYKDDIPLAVKKRRLQEIIDKQGQLSLIRHKREVGQIQEVLVEGLSKRSKDQLKAKNSANKVVIIPKGNLNIGDYVTVKITDCTSATLFGEIVN